MPRQDLHVLLVLALTLGTGAVDAVSYVSLDHVFTANMSGNMALLGIGLATHLGDVEGNIFAFVGFVVGSIFVGRLVRGHGGPQMRTIIDALTIQLVLLLALAVLMAIVDVEVHDPARFVVCFFLAAAMGVQTGVARYLAVADVNTTVATMTLHDLASASRLAGGDSVRWRRRAGVVLALLVGAVIGVLLDKVVRWGGLAFTSVMVVAVMICAASIIEGEEIFSQPSMRRSNRQVTREP